MGKSINASKETHAGVSQLAYKLRSEGMPTNIGDVADQVWKFVETHHKEVFGAYLRENMTHR